MNELTTVERHDQPLTMNMAVVKCRSVCSKLSFHLDYFNVNNSDSLRTDRDMVTL